MTDSLAHKEPRKEPHKEPRKDVIPTVPPAAETLNFRALLDAGIAKSQALSSDLWSDYNEHDPGVTILENLVYALTDLGYRTAHPIEDLLSSSFAATGVGLDQQPLFTGDLALTTAPLTDHDYRKLIFDSIKGVRNVWLRQVDGAVRGLVDVDVQGFTPIPGRAAADWPLILAKVEQKLHENRNVGEDFRFVRRVEEARFAIDARIEIQPNANAEATLAALMLNVETCLNRMPELRDIDTALQQQAAPERVFEGPQLAHGSVTDASLHPMTQEFPTAAILEAMRTTEGVLRVSRTQLVPLNSLPLDSVSVPVLSREADHMQRLRVFRDGVALQLDAERAQYYLLHYEEQQRWQAITGMRRMLDAAYRRVPTGNSGRSLSRYRSIQHLFPAVYGLGEFDAGVPVVRPPVGLKADQALAARRGEVRQLKAYLLFFEQQLANYLAQLENCARLFSFQRQDQTYFFQPLYRQDARDDDQPPGIAPVLGAPEQSRVVDAAAAAGGDWYQDYLDGLKRSSAAHDDPQERQNRALDHLLARFNEHFEDDRLRRLRDERWSAPGAFYDWLAARKREFLKDFITLSARRGAGINLLRPGPTSLEQRIRLKSGFDGHIFVAEHVLLRDVAERGSATTSCDRPPSRPVDAVRVMLPNAAGHARSVQRSVHMVLENAASDLSWPQLALRIARSGARPESYQVFPPGSYQVSVRLDDGGFMTAELVENFTADSFAEALVAELAGVLAAASSHETAALAVLTPVTLPLDFFSSAVSVVLGVRSPEQQAENGIAAGAEHASVENRAFIESVVASSFPAHVAHCCYWLEPDELDGFRGSYDEWIRQLQALRSAASEPDAQSLQRGQAAIDALRAWIHELRCRTFLARRRERWDAVYAEPAPGTEP